jgi:hypothetical protein
MMRTARLAAVLIAVWPVAALAQQAPQQQASEWSRMPRMQLERQFAGPLQDTVVQRWRDPVDGTTCYVYLPITAAHSTPMPSGYVQYGANTIGTISCVAPTPVPANKR